MLSPDLLETDALMLSLTLTQLMGPSNSFDGPRPRLRQLPQEEDQQCSLIDRVKVAISILNYNLAEVERNAAFWKGDTCMGVTQLGL